MQIRQLTESDAVVFQALRLRGLREHPVAFLASFEEERGRPVEQVAEQLRASTPENFHLGAFVEGQLVGIAYFARQEGVKVQHRAYIEAMYVVPERRGLGIGRALLEQLIAYARTLKGLEELGLWVIIGNERAQALYEAAGFQTFCIEPRSIKVGERYYDGAGMILKLK